MNACNADTISKRRIFIFFAAYFTLHILFRVLVSGSAELDEAEQLVWAQEIRLGYGAELPLYTWLQALFFAMFGTNILAVELLRNLLLFVIYLCTFLNAREVTDDENCSLAAMGSLLFMPQIAWESQRIMTHMVLATALAATSLYFFLRMVRTGRLRYYLLFGLSAGLGMLAKYNFGIFLVALVLSAISMKSLRVSLGGKKSVAAFAIFLCVTVAPFSWILTHPDLAMAKSGKLQQGAGGGLLTGYLAGLGELSSVVVSSYAILVLVYLLLIAKEPKNENVSQQKCALRKMLGRTILYGICICTMMVLLFNVTHFKTRWLLPLLYPGPIYLIALTQKRCSFRMLLRLLTCAGVIAGTVLLTLPGKVLFAEHFDTYGRLNDPYDLLAEQLRKAGFSNGIIMAESNLLGGNLKLQFPDSRVLVPGSGLISHIYGAPVLIVWDATDKRVLPTHLAIFAADFKLPLHLGTEPKYIEAPRKYLNSRVMRLGVILITASPEKSGQLLHCTGKDIGKS